jgi:hypothetical protein
MRVLRDNFMFANSHPASADQLVLVEPSLMTPPVAAQPDFGGVGSLDGPVEGATRVDVGDAQMPGDFDVQFDLNASGLGWIDVAGMSYFGLRTGYDVDDVSISGEEPVLLLYLRSEASPSTGPRLAVEYTAVPEPGTAAGAAACCIALAWLARRRTLRSHGRLSRPVSPCDTCRPSSRRRGDVRQARAWSYRRSRSSPA